MMGVMAEDRRVALQADEYLRKDLPAAALNRDLIVRRIPLVRVRLWTSIMPFLNWSLPGN